MKISTNIRPLEMTYYAVKAQGDGVTLCSESIVIIK